MYRALIVDDTPAEVDCMRFLIGQSQLPLQIDSACNGREALDLLALGAYDLLITDIKMPLMDGLQLASAARKIDKGLKIVLVSGFGEFEYAKTAISIGVTDYLMKPLEPAALIETIQTAIDGIDQGRSSARESASVRRHMIYLTLNRDPADPMDEHLPIDYSHMMMLEFEREFFDDTGAGFEQQLSGVLDLQYDFIALYPVRALILLRRTGLPRVEPTDAQLQNARRAVQAMLRDGYNQRCQIGIERIESARDFAPAYQRLEARAESCVPQQKHHTSRAVEAVTDHIHKHYGENLSLGELAHTFFFSPSYLCSIFKRETGVNLIKYINDYRMKKARELLATSQLKINAIAQHVGYKSASYFCQRFRDCYGVTPEQFRQNAPHAGR